MKFTQGILAAIVACSMAAAGQAQEQRIIMTPGQGMPGRMMPPRDPAARKTGTAQIKGRVVAADSGTALRRAQVRIVAPELRESRMASTDDSGRFEFKDLPAGRYQVMALKAGFVSMQFGQRRPNEQGKPLELADGQVAERIDFSLPRGSVITGRIVDDVGEPMAEVMVMAARYRYMNGRRQLVPGRGGQTNDLGQFRIYGLPPGDYYVSATMSPRGFMGESEDRSGYAPTYYPGTANLAEAQRVTARVGQEVTTVDFALAPTRTSRISGVATNSQGQPLTGAFLMMRQNLSVDGGGMMMFRLGGGRVERDGRFTISNVPPGEYRIEVNNPEDENPEIASVPVSVAGDDITNLVIVTSRGATLTGQVAVESGSPPANADMHVMAMASDGEFGPMRGGRGRVKDDWTFELKALLGSRTLRINGIPKGWTLKGIYLNGNEVTDSPLEFSGSETLAGLQVLLTSRITSLGGGVANDRGSPVSDYTVVLFADDATRWGPQSRFIKVGRPDQDGRFRIEAPPETYLAIAVDQIEDGEWTDPEALERLRPFATRIVLTEGDSKTLDLKMRKSN